jgi:hypothetical protein
VATGRGGCFGYSAASLFRSRSFLTSAVPHYLTNLTALPHYLTTSLPHYLTTSPRSGTIVQLYHTASVCVEGTSDETSGLVWSSS